MRRIAIVAVSALVFATSLGHISAPPIKALVSNVIAADASGDPIEEIYGGDELWAYITSATGGFVCISPAVPSGQAYDGCGGEATYSMIPVPPLWAGYLPVAAGNLIPGDWMLVGTEFDLAPSARSQEFHVSACTDCVPDGPLRKSDAFKAVANTAVTAISSICDGLEALSLAKKAKEIYEVSMVAYGIGGMTTGTMLAIARHAGTEIAIEMIKPIPGKMGAAMWAFCNTFSGPGAPFLTSGVDSVFHGWINDPPNSDYTTLVEPEFIPDDLYSPIALAFGRPADRLRVLTAVALSTFERYQGADEAGNQEWAAQQAEHLSYLMLAVTHASNDVADQLDGLAAELVAADPDPANRSVTQAEYDLAVAARARVAAGGFTPAEHQQLLDLDLTEGYIDWLESELGRPIDESPVGKPLDESLNAAAASLRDFAEEWEMFARQAATVAALTGGTEPDNTAPVANDLHLQAIGDQPVSITLPASDTDGDSLTYVVVDGPSNGSLTGDCSDGACTYKANAGFVGFDNFTWKANDGTDDSNVALVSINVFAPPTPTVPVCGDEDGSETPFVTNCVAEYDETPDVQLYRVAGSGPVEIRFDFVLRFAAFNNELGVIEVDGPDGAIGALQPGDSGYLDAAFARAQVIFASGSSASTPDVDITTAGGRYLMFYLIQDSTTTQFRDFNPDNTGSPHAFFSLDALNPDDLDHVQGWIHDGGDHVQFSFEDLFGGGDADFDDIVYNAFASFVPVPPIAATKVVDDSDVAAGAPVRYTITVSNSGDASADVESIVDSLPAGFAYLAGSTTGATTANPSINGGDLTWAGPFTVPAGGSLSLSFASTASSQAGTYLNEVDLISDVETAGSGPTAPVTVTSSVNPPPTSDAGPDKGGIEGSPISLDGTVTNSPAGDTVTTTWSYVLGSGTNGGMTCSFGAVNQIDTTITCTDEGTVTVRLTADDGVNLAVFEEASLTIANANPSVDITAPAAATSFGTGVTVSLSATIGDAGSNDTHTCYIAWGDGSSSAGVVAVGTCTASHAYSGSGSKTITVTATDDDTGQGSDSVGITIEAPPSGGACSLTDPTTTIERISPPASVKLDKLTSNRCIRLFDERQDVTVGSGGLKVDISTAGTFDETKDLTPFTIAAGTVVDSHLLHADNVGSATVRLSGSVTFDADIIGVIVLDRSLDDTDSLGGSATAYPRRLNLRGYELTGPPSRGGDAITISADRRTITVNPAFSSVLDQIRVITANGPP
jgi:uncharacterized repeat protein (TIGR01451 family)